MTGVAGGMAPRTALARWAGMKLTLPALIACAAALTACTDTSPVANEANEAVPAAIEALPPDAIANDAAAANFAASDSAPRETADAPASGGVPAIFHGRWGMVPADCTSTRGDAKGLVTITAEGLKFYESQARPAGNIKTSADSLSGDFAFTGEGQSWTRYQTLELQDGKLVRTESSPMVSYTYVRCT